MVYYDIRQNADEITNITKYSDECYMHNVGAYIMCTMFDVL